MLDSLLAVSAITPALLLVIYFQTRDLFPEPRRAVWLTFALGLLTVIPVALIGFPIMGLVRGIDSLFGQALAHAFCVAAIPEELFKFLVLFLYCGRIRHFDEPMDGIVYGVTASLGFATFENVLYVVDGGFPVALSRALTALPCHALLGVVMGYHVGMYFNGGSQGSTQGPSRTQALMMALAVPILFHGLYDLPLLYAQRVHTAEGELVGIALPLLGLLPLTLGALFIGAAVVMRRLGDAQRQRMPHVMAPTVTRELPTVVGAILASTAGTLLLGLALASVRGAEIPEGENWEPRFWIMNVCLAALLAPLGGAMFWRGIRRANE